MTRGEAQKIAAQLVGDAAVHYSEQARLAACALENFRVEVDIWLASGAYRRGAGKPHHTTLSMQSEYGLSLERSANTIRDARAEVTP